MLWYKCQILIIATSMLQLLTFPSQKIFDFILTNWISHVHIMWPHMHIKAMLNPHYGHVDAHWPICTLVQLPDSCQSFVQKTTFIFSVSDIHITLDFGPDSDTPHCFLQRTIFTAKGFQWWWGKLLRLFFLFFLWASVLMETMEKIKVFKTDGSENVFGSKFRTMSLYKCRINYDKKCLKSDHDKPKCLI